MKVGLKQYKTVHTVYSQIGSSEMKSYMKMGYCTKEQD